MSITDPLAEFRSAVLERWLPAYCHDPKRQYEIAGFRESSMRVTSVDAKDCLRAISGDLVSDGGGGRYRARKSTAFESLFWEGSKTKVPRRITLWLEPVISFASLARLHFDHGWPIELLGTQPKSWAFDIAAHCPVQTSNYRILGEVKKSVREAEALIDDLARMSTGEEAIAVRANSRKKWIGLLASKPLIVWIVGPSEFSKVFAMTYPSPDSARLVEAAAEALSFSRAVRPSISIQPTASGRR